MKSTYALAMTALLLLGIGGSVTGYRAAVNKVTAHEASAEGGEHGAAGTEEAGTSEAGAPEGGTSGASTEGTGAETETSTPAAGEPDTAAPEDGAQQDQLTEGELAEQEQADAATSTQQDVTDANATAAAVASGDAAAGQQIFASSCAGCHGAQGQGGIGPAMSAHATGWSQPEFVQTLREGLSPRGELAGTMPRFGEEQLSDSDINNIYAWVQTLK
ncbi:MAG: cytochrome c [Deinococcus sp.]|nr:cytochrome c [Deinococcus sp.]